MNSPFATLVIRSVIACYAVWGGVVIYDLASCEARKPGQCEPQRSELRGAMTTISSTLLAWLADSPFIPRSVEQSKTGRRERQFDEGA